MRAALVSRGDLVARGGVAGALVLASLFGCASVGCGGGAKTAAVKPIDGGSGGPPTSWGGINFPWTVFSGHVPDVPPSSSGATYYADPVNGNDAWDGTSFTFVSGSKGPKKTAGAAMGMKGLQPGDTVLLGGGIYREYPGVFASGTASSPITIGSYGHGTGAPIIDGGLKPATWTKYTAQGQTTVWQTSTAGQSKITKTQPVLGIYVNGTNGESALREVIHGQIAKYASDPLPASQTQADITDNSNSWYFDPTGNVLYADFGGSLGTGDPNQADISILFNTHGAGNAQPLLTLTNNYLNFVGLTLRASSWSGVFSQGKNISFDQCDIKFNGGGAFSWGGVGNSLTNSRVWMNVLDNWPRFNNGNSGGGWPGAVVFYASQSGTARGNVVYGNGGEGIIFYATDSGETGSNNVIANNIVYDNFSVNVYNDNTQGVLIQQNFIFNHPRDVNQSWPSLLSTSGGYNSDFGRRLSPICISLGDEPGSSYDGAAHLANITVINNIVVGGDRGIFDYDDGTSGGVGHGLKNDLIANNTFVIGLTPLPGDYPSYGWANGSAPGADTNSFVENNLIAVQNSGDFWVSIYATGIGPGITCDYNLYSGAGAFATGTENQTTPQTLVQWQGAHSGWDVNSMTADAMLTDVTEFNQTAAQKPVYDWTKATPLSGSPAHRGGTTQTTFNTDFTGATRPSGNFDTGALALP